MSEAFFPLSLLVAFVFLAAALLKLTSFRLFVAELRDYRILHGQASTTVAAALLVSAELAGAALVLVPATHALGCAVLLILLVIFTVVTTRALLAGRTLLSCACLGRASRDLDWGTPARNVLLMVPLAGSLVGGDDVLGPPDLVLAGITVCLGWVLLEALKMYDKLGVMKRG
ncbi:MAG: hypothetical protein M3Y75_05485 [Actinomycetota bacterium]|nr:hypothetical protein [Actinomycetota bacterium]